MNSAYFDFREWLIIESGEIAVRTTSYILAMLLAERVIEAEVMLPRSVAAVMLDREREPIEYMCLKVFERHLNADAYSSIARLREVLNQKRISALL